MVAFPWLITPTDISTVLSNTSWDRAMLYLNGTWHTYDNTRPARYNAGFPKIDRTMGLWVHFTNNSTLIGDSPIHTGNITVYVHQGWNLVEGGLPFLIGEVFADVQYSYVQSTNITNSSEMEDLGDNDTMISGKAYWVYVDHDYTITIDTDAFTISTQQGIIPASVGQNTNPENAPDQPQSSEISPVQVSQGQHHQGYGIPLILLMAALGVVYAMYWRRKR